jgi:glutamate 5-kinase
MATGETRSGMGSGGMEAKLLAARMAGAAGISLAICDGRVERPLSHFVAGGGGTLFLPPRAAKGRKAWLAGRITVAGTISVDAGAAAALRRGASLLAAGVRGVEGRFQRGDVVAIAGPDGDLLARGLAGYDAEDARLIVGLRNDVQASALGYAPRAALVHADHLVLI